MSRVIETEAIADADGGVHLHLPRATASPHSKLTLRVEIAEEGNDNRFSKRFATKEEYLAAIDRLFAKSNDPTFVPPEDQELPEIEPL